WAIALITLGCFGVRGQLHRALLLGAGEEIAQQPGRFLRALHLRHVPARWNRDLLGPGQPFPDVTRERRRHERVVVSPDEEGGRPQLTQAGIEAASAERRLEIDVARRGEEGV